MRTAGRKRKSATAHRRYNVRLPLLLHTVLPPLHLILAKLPSGRGGGGG